MNCNHVKIRLFNLHYTDGVLRTSSYNVNFPHFTNLSSSLTCRFSLRANTARTWVLFCWYYATTLSRHGSVFEITFSGVSVFDFCRTGWQSFSSERVRLPWSCPLGIPGHHVAGLAIFDKMQDNSVQNMLFVVQLRYVSSLVQRQILQGAILLSFGTRSNSKSGAQDLLSVLAGLYMLFSSNLKVLHAL